MYRVYSSVEGGERERGEIGGRRKEGRMKRSI